MDVKNIIESHDPLPYVPRIELLLTVNAVQHRLRVAPAARLVDILREDLGFTGTKISCEIGRCGACAVHMNGKLVNSCLVMAYQANHSSICTIEGLGGEDIHPIQRAFLEEGGFQCGYCTPGMIMAVKALLDEYPKPTQAQIQEGLSGNLCRCTGYGGIIRAVERVSLLMKEKISSDFGLPIERINQMEKEVFVGTVGWVFEHSPWVAEKAWESLPFKSSQELLQTMVTIVEGAEKSMQLALLRAHPDLGTRLQMSEVSQKEQAGVGLDRLSKDEYAEFVSLNQQYVNTFGFPFIMAVKEQSKDTILLAMRERVKNNQEEECAAALNEVKKIAAFRLIDLIND
jgi:2-oxo-4-hydroxy-4-carboxy-5-ureidoimidazoline decarboxylase